MATQSHLSIINPHPQKLPGPALLHHLVFGDSHQRLQSPQNLQKQSLCPALDYQATNGHRTVLSYPQLHQKAQLLANEIAQRRRRIHIGTTGTSADPGSPDSTPVTDFVVPVLIPQAPELYLSLLAILKAGGAFCPIQLDAPTERVRFILDDVAAQVVLTTAELASRLPADLSAEVVLVDQLNLGVESEADKKEIEQISKISRIPKISKTTASSATCTSENDLAYVMYTSGSTGTPKGVGIPHIAATQSLLAHDRHIPSFERFLQFAAPTFDVSVFEIFFPWLRGATLVSCSRADMLNDLPATIRSLHVDACELTPTVAGSLLQSRSNAPNLRLLLTIGEMLTEPVVCEFGTSPERPGILWAMYGPTEAAIHCTLQPALDGAASFKSIGFPLDTVSAYVLEIPDSDAQQTRHPRPVPIGQVGELAVGGFQLARGYINRPEQTASAFIETDSFGRLYRTGDKARITPDGVLECLGRISGGQVKLRGQRIELGEVEQAVLRADGCLGCAAAVIHGNLVAFCNVGARTEVMTEPSMEDRLLEASRAWLPRFMIPGEFVILSTFPRLASGKVDRKSLVDQYVASATTQSAGLEISFQDNLDRLLHDVTRQVLGHDIDRTASLAAAGLDSLRSIRLATLIRDAGFCGVGALDVLDAHSLQDLHSRIRDLETEASEESLVSLPSLPNLASIISTLPALQEAAAEGRISNPTALDLVTECSPVQAAMLSQTLADPRAYCNWVELEFERLYNVDAIVACFHSLIQKNEALRASFAHFDGRFVQVVWREPLPNQVQIQTIGNGSLARDYVFESEQAFLCPFQVDIIRNSSSDGEGHVRALLRIHHAVYDGWSMDLICADLEAMLQNGHVEERPPYSRIVQHHLSHSPGQKDASRQFWGQLLNGYQPSPLPGLRAQTLPDTAVSTKSSLLTGTDFASVERLARDLECGTQSIFQAALAWLWSSLIGSTDVVLGTVASGRALALDGIETIVGPCLQTVPVRTDLSQMRTIRDLINTIQSVNRVTLPHASLPLSEIKKTAGLLPGQSLFDVLFVYQKSLFSQKSTEARQKAVWEVAHQDYLETKLLWEIEPVENTFLARVTYHRDVFPDDVMDILLEQYRCIVDCMASHADDPLTLVRSCFPHDLMACHNLDYKPFDGIADLAGFVEETAKRTPGNMAICFASSIDDDGAVVETMTYRELDRLANRIARRLQSCGAVPGDAVAIIMEKSILLYAGILGILKAGCAYLPLLPTIPAARAALILDQAGISLSLMDTAAAGSLGCQLPLTILDLQMTPLDTISDAPIDNRPVDPDRGSYIIYTSGSTGIPKGVIVTQLNICSNLDVLSRIYPVQHDSRLLQSCSQAFDVSVFEIFFTWKMGMCLCSAVNDVLFEDLERAIRQLRVTHLSMTPTVAALVDPNNAPTVDVLMTAGEAITEKVARMWTPKLFVGYGPSETTNICSTRQRQPDDVINNLGHEFENTATIILHLDGLEPVAKGAMGELCYAGDQVAAGYLRQPEVTARVFIQHPSFGRIYRSGDIGRMLPDGTVLFSGRKDDQIKLRGQRIELREINAVLRESRLATEPQTLLLRRSNADADLLVSFFVPPESAVEALEYESANTAKSTAARLAHIHNLDEGSPPLQSAIQELFSLLKSRVPTYMVPTHLVPVSAIPLTPAGKVNRALLKEMFDALSRDLLAATACGFDDANAGGDSSAGAHWSEAETKVASLVSEALDVDEHIIGRWTPLPSLGLDSISAIRLSKHLHESMQRRLPISTILKNASVARLAQILEDVKRSDKDGVTPLYSLDLFSSAFLAELKLALTGHGLAFHKVLPCTPLQEGMLVSPVARGKSYINRMLFKLHVSPSKVRSAWLKICERQEILRTCFATTDNAHHPIAQVVLLDWQPLWHEFAEADCGDMSIESLIEKHVHLLADPVDSFQPPVSCAVIYQPHGSFLSLVCHHAIYDGEAMEHLLVQVEQAIREDAISSKANPPVDAPSFDSFLSQALALPSSTDTFWENHLEGFRPSLFVPRSNATIGDKQARIFVQTLSLPLSIIRQQSASLGVSVLTTFQSVWANVLCLLTEQSDVCFGNVYNGRSLPLGGIDELIDELVAPCFNTLPLRIRLANLRSNKNMMDYFQDMNPDMMLHQFTPLRRIQRQHLAGQTNGNWQDQRSHGRLFDSLLLLQQPSRPLDDTIWTLLRDDGEMDYPLVCELVPDQRGDTMSVRLHHNGDFVSDEAATLIMGLVEYLAGTLLQFSSSQIPRRDNLPSLLRDQFTSLDFAFEDPSPLEFKGAEDGDIDKSKAESPIESWSQKESAIRSILSSLSGVAERHIQRNTTLYRLGLDSVRAVQVAARLRKQCGLLVSAVDVMEYPSSLSLARILDEREAAASTPTAVTTIDTTLKAFSSPPSLATTSSSRLGMTGDTSQLSSPNATSSPAELDDFADFRELAFPAAAKLAGISGLKDIEAILPCTPLQSSLLVEFYRSHGRHYYNFVTLQADSLTVEKWADSWEHVTATVPILRTGIVSIENDNLPVTGSPAMGCDSPFAMVQYHASAAIARHPRRVTLVHQKEQSFFNLPKWKMDVTQRALSNTHIPPWQVVIVESANGQGAVCHLGIHHVLYDAASLDDILESVSRHAQGQTQPPAPSPPHTETVVAEILRQATSAATSTDLSEAWERLSLQATAANAFPNLTPLRVGSPKTNVSFYSSSKSFTELAGAAKVAGFTIHAAVQAAWTRILAAYIGDPGVVFGAVLSGRHSEVLEKAVFPCLVTLPVVVQNHASNRHLVQQLMETNVLLQKSQHIPMSQVQKWLGHSGSRLFDTLLVYQNIGKFETGGDEGHVPRPWRIAGEEAVVDYPVSLEVIPRVDGSVQFQITFDDSVLPEEQAVLLLRQFDAMICHILFHPDGSEDDLASQNTDVFSVLPPRDDELPSPIKLLHEFVEHQAREIPQKTALQFVTDFDTFGHPIAKEWTYAALNQRGNTVARVVAKHAEPGCIIAVCFDKCPEAFFAILGILKAGCSFVALDPGAPFSRKEFILQDSRAALLLTDSQGASRYFDLNSSQAAVVAGVTVAIIDESALAFAPSEEDAVSDSSPAVARRQTVPSDVCYCLYTSGTTGTPKGCAITHENAVQAMLAFQELFREHYDSSSRWLQFASFHFDVSVLEQYWTWSVGVVLVGAPRDLILEDLAGTIARLDITHIDLTPSLGRLLDPKDVPSLCRGVFITGGEPLKQEMLDPWGPTGAVHNFYGPTEATIGVTSYPQVPQNGRASNIGRQFPNVGSFVFRPGTQTPVLQGAVGELCVSGKLVGQGYLNRDDLTRERFPTTTRGERFYRTGDLVRLLHDGCFDFLGRADDQVKLRGQRLEIGEINHAIRLGLGDRLDDVATLVIRDEVNKKDFLVSFIVMEKKNTANTLLSPPLKAILDDSGSVDLSHQVQAACRERLPGYMVPTYVVQLPFIPLSANNKAEAKELRKLFQALSAEDRMKTTGAGSSTFGGSSQHPNFINDSNTKNIYDTAETMTAVLRQLSLLDQGSSLVPPGTNIFELGIDSISVLRFSRALKKAGLPATPSLILSHPVIDSGLIPALAAKITELENNGSSHTTMAGAQLEARLLVEACQHRHLGHACSALHIEPEDIEYIAPCSALQQGMVSRSRSGQGQAQQASYFNTFILRLRGPPSERLDRLQAAWQAAVQRNSVLRTRFVVTNDGVVQVALKRADIPWTQLSANHSQNDSLLKEHHDRWVHENDGDVISSPLEFFVVPRQGQEEQYDLVIHIFHGLYDATSLDLILDQVLALYHGRTSQETASTSTFLEALVHGPLRSYGGCRPFWEAHFKTGCNFQPLACFAAQRDQADIVVKRTLAFDAINGLCTSLGGVTHAAIVQGLWVAALQQTFRSGSKSNVTALGLVLSGRTMEDIDHVESIVGPLFNTLPFHLQLSSGRASDSTPNTWKHLAQACHDFNTAILPFQQVPLRDIQKWCSAGQPLFDILFSFQMESEEAKEATKNGLWTEAESSTQADYPLALEASLHTMDNGRAFLDLLLVAKAGYVDGIDAANDLLDKLASAAEAMAANPLGPVLGITYGAGEAEDGSQQKISAPKTSSKQAETETKTPFHWQGYAAKIRQELALLSGTATLDAIHQKTTLLELGLDSVDTIKLSARLRAQGIRLTNSQLIRGQCISGFLDILSADQDDQRGSTDGNQIRDTRSSDSLTTRLNKTCDLLRDYLDQSGRDLSSVELVLPPTPLQEGLVADMIESDFTRYFNHDILELQLDAASGPITTISLTDRVKSAWKHAIEANPILRTSFSTVGSPDLDMAYCQVVTRSSHLDMDDIITDHIVADWDELESLVDETRQRASRYQGESGLLHLAFVHVSSQRKLYLVLSIAHALYDGWSLDALHRSVEAAYRGRGTAVTTAERYLQHLGGILPVSVSSGGQPQASEIFWRGFLTHARPTYLRRENERRSTVTRLETASSVTAAELKAFCQGKAVSQQVVGQACWAAVLATLTRSLDVIFGVVLSGRGDSIGGDGDGYDAAESLLFPTMNTVLVRVVLHSTSTAELLQYMQSNMGNISEHQRFPLRKVQRMVVQQTRGEAERNNVFNTLFLFQKRLTEDEGEENKRSAKPIMQSVEGVSDVEYPVCIEMEVVGDMVVWRTACDSRYVSSSDEAVHLIHKLDMALSFLIRSASSSSSSSILCFDEEGGVSVCGLPCFTPEAMAKDISSHERLPASNTTTATTWSPTEQALRETLSAVSGVPVNSIHKTGQTLYHLGLDSISAIKVSALLRKTHGIVVGVRQLLSAGSITDMASMAAMSSATTITTMDDANNAAGIVDDAAVRDAGIATDEMECVVPATAMQTHMVSVWQASEGTVFFPTFYYRLSGVAGGRDGVLAAWNQLVVEFPILRTILLASSTEEAASPLLQVVLKAASETVSSAPVAEDAHHGHLWPALPSRHEKHALAFLSVHEPTDSRDTFHLSLRIHHALYDAVSLPVMLGRLQQLCGGDKNKRRTEGTDTNSMMAAWTRTVMEQTSEAAQKHHQQFWTRYLQSAGDEKAEAEPSVSVSSRLDRISLYKEGVLDSMDVLRNLAAENGLSLQSVLFAAYARTLCGSSGHAGERDCSTKKDAVFGVYLANRAENYDASHASNASADALKGYPTLCLVPLFVASPWDRQLTDVARQIQLDIHAISSPSSSLSLLLPAPATAALWQIRDWTGVEVGSFVNFLLPSEDESNGTSSGEPLVSVQLESVDDRHVNETDEESSTSTSAVFPPSPVFQPDFYQSLRNNRVRHAYKDAVDIEMAVRGTRLDVGVFGPRARLSDEKADELISSLVRNLGEVS